MKIVDFTKEFLPEAYRLAMENYEEERERVFSLSEKIFIPPLDELAENGLSVAAVEDDALLGFLGAFGPWQPVFCTQNVRGVFSPLHAHGAVKENRVRIYRRMYQAAAEKWVRAGAASHAISLYAHDAAAQEAFYIYGFGVRCMELMRSAGKPICVGESEFIFTELEKQRHAELRGLRCGLGNHLAQSPCFMQDTPEDTEKWIRRKEENPPRVFAAMKDGTPAAYIEFTDEGESFAAYAPHTANICGAYCLPEYRGKGVMKNLLGYAQSVLHAEGAERIGVDCESFNPTALGFWTKYFDEYSRSVVRRIDENAVEMK